MAFHKSNWFKRLKNFIIGVGASVVMVGALAKILSWPYGNEFLMAGLLTEAFLFLLLGILPPEKDYYWEKLYPGLESYHSEITPLAAGEAGVGGGTALNGDVVENQLGGMLTEMQSMSNSLGALKALQEVDFSGTSDQISTMNNFYNKLNDAMADLGDSLEDTKRYKEQMSALNTNLASLNGVYGNVLTAMTGQKAATVPQS